MVCVLLFGLLSCIEENSNVLIAFYSLDHLNKHFRSIALNVWRNAVFSGALKGKSLKNQLHISLKYLFGTALIRNLTRNSYEKMAAVARDVSRIGFSMKFLLITI